MHPNHQIASDWLSAFNAHDLDALLHLYGEGAVHFSPKLKQRLPDTGGLICGRPALRSWWADALERLPSLRYEPRTITANEDRVFMEYIRTVDGEGEMAVAEVLEISSGKIVASRVYHG